MEEEKETNYVKFLKKIKEYSGDIISFSDSNYNKITISNSFKNFYDENVKNVTLCVLDLPEKTTNVEDFIINYAVTFLNNCYILSVLAYNKKTKLVSSDHLSIFEKNVESKDLASQLVMTQIKYKVKTWKELSNILSSMYSNSYFQLEDYKDFDFLPEEAIQSDTFDYHLQKNDDHTYSVLLTINFGYNDEISIIQAETFPTKKVLLKMNLIQLYKKIIIGTKIIIFTSIASFIYLKIKK